MVASSWMALKSTVMRMINKNDTVLQFNKDEHWVVTPDKMMIKLHQLRKNLFYLIHMQPSTIEETEHLKQMRIDPRYRTDDIGMLATQESER